MSGMNDSAAEFNTSATTMRRPLGDVDKSFYLIGVGASAGGLEAIKSLVGKAPEDFRHSFVIVQHLSPDYKSMMGEILSRETAMKVTEVSDDMQIEPGHIYLMPPKWNVVIQGTDVDSAPLLEEDEEPRNFDGLKFSLLEKRAETRVNFPIDMFFQSLAEAAKGRSVGIILSGTGSDGSHGLRAIKDHGGLCIAQDPKTAAFDGMPTAAIDTQLVDIIAPPEEVLDELTRYFEDLESGNYDPMRMIEGEGAHFEHLIGLVSAQVDIDFTKYKEGTLKRRTARRMKLARAATVESYIRIAYEDGDELARLGQDFLVGATSFFRDEPEWGELLEHIIPELFATGGPSDPVKIWSLGCSTGEEAYTIALLMAEYRKRHNISRSFRVIASDVNGEVVDRARNGKFPLAALSEIPETYHDSEFITVKENQLEFSATLKQQLVFSRHNALVDPPYIRTDLVICRNVLIYLSQELQKQLLSVASFSLRQGGYLFLGTAENMSSDVDAFDQARPRSRIFRNNHRVNHSSVKEYLRRQFRVRDMTSWQPPALVTRDRKNRSVPATVLRNLAKRTDACVLILNAHGRVTETFGEYKDYLDLPDDAFSANVTDLLPQELRHSTSLMLRKATSGETASRTGLTYQLRGQRRHVDIYCEKSNEFEAEPHLVVTLLSSEPKPVPMVATSPLDVDAADLKDQTELILRLETEIADLRDMLTTTSEELGVVNEEMQTTNEELVTANEELQASNEELQSTNEELHTVNTENAERILDLEAANEDIENLLNHAEFAILFLDDDMRIRRFSQGFMKYMDLLEADTGRRLSTFNSFLEGEDMSRVLDACHDVLKTGAPYSNFVRFHGGGEGFITINEFKARSQQNQGLAIKLIDMTEIHALRQEIEKQRDRLENLIEKNGAGYWDWDLASGKMYLSPNLKAMLGYAENEIEHTPAGLESAIHPEDLPIAHANFEKHVASQGEYLFYQDVRYFHKDGSIVWVNCRGHVIEWGSNGEPLRAMGVHTNITRFKTSEHAPAN